MSKHYGIATSVKNYKSNCAYIHYIQIPKALKKTELLQAVTKLVTKLGLTDGQLKLFERKIKFLIGNRRESSC
jgi:hypothetical protein